MEIGEINKFYLYLSYKDKASNLEYTYELAEKIDGEVLKAAVKDAVECFPFFS